MEITEAQRTLGDLIYEIAEAAERGDDWHLSVEDVAILGPELRRLRGIAYRANVAASGRMGASGGITAAGWVAAAEYIAGDPT